MATSFNSLSNPQQLSSYQQTQPGSTPAPAPAPAPLVTTQKPLGGGEQVEDEDYFERLRRMQSSSTGTSTAPAPTSTAPTTTGQVSPVSSNGRLTTAPAQVAAPQPTQLAGGGGYTAPTTPGTGTDGRAAPTAATSTVSGNMTPEQLAANQAWAAGGKQGAQPYQQDNSGAQALDRAITAPPLAAAPSGDPTPAQAAALGLGWVDRNNPNWGKPGFVGSTPQSGAGAAPGTAPAGPPAPYQGYQQAPTPNLGSDPFSSYQGTNINVAMPGNYTPGQISQWGGFDEGQQGALQQQLMEQILRNPHTMNDSAVAQLKEQQKESATSFRDQLMGQADSRGAARGVFNPNGTDQRGIQSDFGSHLMGAYRDIDLRKLSQDRADEMAALGQSEELMSGRFDRASTGYGNTLRGQGAQEQANQFGAQFGLDRAGLDFNVQNANAQDRRAVADSQFNAQDAALRRAIAGGNFQMDGWNNDQNRLSDTSNQNANRVVDNRRIDVQSQLGNAGIAVDQARLAEQASEFDDSHNLDYLRYLQNGQQFDDTQGFNWAQMNADNQYRWTNV